MRPVAILILVSMLAGSAPARGGALSQLGFSRNAGERNREAARLSRRAGQDSIGRGRHNLHRGRHLGPAGVALLALGAMQVARGMLGLMASAKAGRLSRENDANAANLSEVEGGAPATDLGGVGGRSVAGVPLDAATLRAGELGEATGELREYFGVSAEELTAALAAGTDPRLVFMNAPNNPLSAAEADEAMREALRSEKEMLAGEAAPTGPVAASLAPEAPPAPGAGDRIPAAAPAAKDTSLRDSLRDKLLEAEQDEMLSPEVRAALRERELVRQRNDAEPESLFTIVHKKYRERHLSMLPP